MQEQIERFVALCQELVNAAYQGSTSIPPLSIEEGKRYARIVKGEGMHRSVYCFVDMSTGDVYKAASWKKPAKHVRGNISNDPSAFMTGYGAAYLR